jgi:predicted aconitase
VELLQQEKELLDGRHGRILQKIMKTLVLYGQAVGAAKLIEIEGPGHFALSGPELTIGPDQDFLDELTASGLKTRFPFTLDPRGVLDFQELGLNTAQANHFRAQLDSQAKFDKSMLKLGLRDGENAYTCTPYLPEVGNIPKQGTILAWSESSCVVYVNSILGARTNRNGAMLDLLSNIVGKTPLYGLLTDEGRKARWLIDLKTTELPHPQLLGGAIGLKVLEDVPYIKGLDRFLGSELTLKCLDYLKEMGAACAAIGAVGLYHVEHMTPEAIDQTTALLLPNHQRYAIDDGELHDLRTSYANIWQAQDAVPRRCLIGCPHLSLRELRWWADGISQSLARKNRGKIAVDTVICAAPQVLERFKVERGPYESLTGAGVKLSVFCLEGYMNNPHCAGEPIITNSNKLRTFTSARFYPDEELLELVTGGTQGGV